jgi:hypothetical protein
MEASGQLNAPAALPQVPIWPHSRSGRCGEQEDLLPLPGIDPAYSLSLYRLSCAVPPLAEGPRRETDQSALLVLLSVMLAATPPLPTRGFCEELCPDSCNSFGDSRHRQHQAEAVLVNRAFNISLSLSSTERLSHVKRKTIPVTGRGGTYGCKTSRRPHILDNRLTDGGEVVGLTRWPLFTLRKIPGTHFCKRLSRPQDHSAAGRIRSIEKFRDLIWESNPRPSGL